MNRRFPSEATALFRSFTPARLAMLGLAGLLIGLSLYSTLGSQPGRYIPDNLLEDVMDPGRYLSQQAYLWDEVRGLGRPRADFSPVVTGFQAGVAALGAPPWVVERLTHALFISVAGLGVLLLMRALRPRIGLGHAVAAFAYAFAPLTAEYLQPSSLFLQYALAPWFAFIVFRGVRSDDPWRWAAAFALVVAAPGLINGAALVYALMPAALIALFFAAFESRGAVWSWAWRAGLLSALTCSAGIVMLMFSGPNLAPLLHATELPSDIARTSSWSESWRGLGLWLSYFPDITGGLFRPQGTPYFTDPAVIAATFVAPLGALLALALGRWRHRLLFGAMLLVGLVVMVGIHGEDGPSPLGRVISFAFDRSDLALGFRTTYKAGSTLMLGVVVLLGVGVEQALDAASRRRLDLRPSQPARTRLKVLALAGVPVAVVVGLVLAATPFWDGRLYPESDGFRSVPRYWDRALSHFDTGKQDRVLVLPGAEYTRYRWGNVYDGFFGGLAPVTPVINRGLGNSTLESGNLTAAIDEYVSSPTYVEGSLAPILRRLGVRWVLLQNDVDWQEMSVSRPATYQALRTDPELRRAAAFGHRGKNTARPEDAAARVFGERSLPPVEVYEVKGKHSPLPVVVDGPPLLVAGAGDSWPALAVAGLLDGPPVAYTGDADDVQLRQLLGSGAQAVVTDGNRRRQLSVGTSRPSLSPTLTAGDHSDQAPIDLFDRPDAQSVATYADADEISASRYGFPLGAREAASRPANAFDGVERTAWLLRGGVEPGEEWIAARLRQPTTVSAVSALAVAGGRWRIRTADLIAHTEDGALVRRRLRFDGAPADRARVSLGVDDVSEIELRIGSVDGPGPVGLAGAGIADVRVATPAGPLDLREFIRTPGDLAARATSDEALADALATQPPRYELRRVSPVKGGDEETELRREIDTFGEHSYELSATVRIDARTADSAVDGLLGGRAGAVGTSRPGGHGGLAVDGELSTGWEPIPRASQRLDVRFPARPVSEVEVIVDSGNRGESTPGAGPRRPRLSRVEVGVGRASIRSRLPATPRCLPESPPGSCLERHVVRVPATEADHLSVTLGRVGAVRSKPLDALPKVAEVRMDGRAVSQTTEPAAACAPLFAVDGEPVPVGLPDPLQLLSGRSFELQACERVRLGPGRHRIESLPGLSGAVLTASLVPARGPREEGRERSRAGQVKVVDRSATRLDLEVKAPEGSMFLGRIPADDGWDVDHGGLRRYPIPLDTFSAWSVEDDTAGPVRLSYGPQRIWELALALSLGSAAWCLWRVTRRRGRAP